MESRLSLSFDVSGIKSDIAISAKDIPYDCGYTFGAEEGAIFGGPFPSNSGLIGGGGGIRPTNGLPWSILTGGAGAALVWAVVLVGAGALVGTGGALIGAWVFALTWFWGASSLFTL